MNFKIHHGRCEQVLIQYGEDTFDCCVTDPPYGLRFMNKHWDYSVPSASEWKEVFRVLKPGAHLLAFSGARTYHRMVVNIEDAGFEIRDQIMWIYGSGFPKSHNGDWGGTALKPSHEPIVVARKPLIGTLEDNFRKHGVGGLNIEISRIDLNGDYKSKPNGRPSLTGLPDNYDSKTANTPDTIGRWPANIIHDGSEDVINNFPESAGAMAPVMKGHSGKSNGIYGDYSNKGDDGATFRNDSGSAARFFYCAKASPTDREEGLKDMDATVKMRRNTHPTVKPTELMRYLVNLVSPQGGLVLDPYMGSGSTGKACMLEKMRFVGIEAEAAYMEIASARIKNGFTMRDTQLSLF